MITNPPPFPLMGVGSRGACSGHPLEALIFVQQFNVNRYKTKYTAWGNAVAKVYPLPVSVTLYPAIYFL